MNSLAFLEFTTDLSSPQVASAFDELPLWSAMFGLVLLEHVPLEPATQALDVGCGTGFPLIELAQRLGPRSHVHGIDLWREALKRASAKIADRGVTNVTLHEASAARMPFADGTFNLIVSNLGVNNFDDRAAALRECRRVAAPGATLALTTNLQGHMQAFYDVFAAVLRRVGSEADLSRLQEHIAHRASIPGLTALLESSGFTIRRVVEQQGSMRFASGTAMLNHYFIKLGFLDGWKQVVPANPRLVFDELVGALDARAERDGGLRLTIPMAYVEATTAAA
jgi:arsenite methyltransferase